MRIACLVGNGSSVAYNDQLGIGPLTQGIVDAFNALAGTDTAGDALAEFANGVTGDDRSDFEGLLGPLDAITQALPALGGASAPFHTLPWIANPLTEASLVLSRLHRLGLGTVLGLIANSAKGEGGDALERVQTLTAALVNAADEDLLTVATLNYDGLLHAAFPNDRLTDMAEGHRMRLHLVGDAELRSWPLRTTPNFPGNRDIHLISLHGSLGWLRFPYGGPVRKFEIEDLRGIHFWERLAAGELEFDQAVVLTDRKERVVITEPFALSYRVFTERLIDADAWCIVGYGFGDAPVNDSLADALRQRRALDLHDPPTLILGLGAPGTIRRDMRRALRWLPPPPLYIDGQGLPNSVGAATWKEWLTA